MAAPDAQQMLKMMIMKKLKREGAPAVKDVEVDGLDDVEIPPEHEELLEGLAKLFKSADRNFLTVAELREFEILLEKKGVVETGGLLKRGGILEDVEMMRKEDLTEEQLEKARQFSLHDHLKPAIQKLSEESSARKKAMAMGKLVKEKEGPATSTKKASSSSDSQGKLKEVKVKVKISKGKDASTEAGIADKNGKGVETKNKSGEDGSRNQRKEKASKNESKLISVGVTKSSNSTSKTSGSHEAKQPGHKKTASNNKQPDISELKEVLTNEDEGFQRTNEKALRVRADEEEPKEPQLGTGYSVTSNIINRNIKHRTGINKDGSDTKTDFAPAQEDSSGDTFQHMLYSAESLNTRPGPDREGPPVVTYKISLKCLSRGTSDVRTLELWEVPKTGHVLKDRIERQLQIPTSFQHDLCHAGKPIEDSTAITSVGLRAKGRLELTYLCEGELEEVRVCMKFFEYFVKLGQHRHYSIFTGMPMEYSMLCHQGITERIAEKLAEELFVPWDSDVKYANRVYFLQRNGIDHVLDVYEFFIMESWRTMLLQFKMIEVGCIKILAAIGCSTLNRQKVISADGHGFVMQSLLRVLIRPPRGNPLVDTSRAPGPARTNNFLLKELLDAVIAFFVNYRECQEVHIDICSKNNSIDQIISIVHCPTFSVQQAQDCLCLLACCMHSSDTHKWLCRNHTLDCIADSVKVHEERGVASSDDITLLHYYAQVTLAHLVTTSVHFMSKKVTEKLVLFMEDFLRNSKPSTIQKLEKAQYPRAGWTPFLPYLKVLLAPVKINSDLKNRANRSETATILHVMNLSVETMLFVMQVMSIGDPYKARRQLLEEKILSYALCLSANTPRKLLPKARSVVTSLRSNSSKPVPIPKLNIMARAKLAYVHFGLKKVMDRKAEEIKLEVSPPPPRPAPRTAAVTEFNPMICVISM